MQTTKLPMISVRQLRKLVGRKMADIAKHEPIELALYFSGDENNTNRSDTVWIAYRQGNDANTGKYELLPDGAFENTIIRYPIGRGGLRYAQERRRPMTVVYLKDFLRANLPLLYLGV